VQIVDVFTDPSCPWAWNTSRWLKEVAPNRDLMLRWRSYSLQFRDEGELPVTMPDEVRRVAPALRAASHRLLRVFEALRADVGDDAVDSLYTEWGHRIFLPGSPPTAPAPDLLSDCLGARGLDPAWARAADDPVWDAEIASSMEIAFAIGGPKTQTPVVVLAGDPPKGLKGPVMSPAPTGEAALRLWDAFRFLAEQPGFFELTRPRRMPFLASTTSG
jgi:hypothetical protein